MHVCVCVHVCVHAYMHACIHTNTHTCQMQNEPEMHPRTPLLPTRNLRPTLQGDALYAAEISLSLEKLNFQKLRDLHDVGGWRPAHAAARCCVCRALLAPARPLPACLPSPAFLPSFLPACLLG